MPLEACPKCQSTRYGTNDCRGPVEEWVRYCNDEFHCGCRHEWKVGEGAEVPTRDEEDIALVEDFLNYAEKNFGSILKRREEVVKMYFGLQDKEDKA